MNNPRMTTTDAPVPEQRRYLSDRFKWAAPGDRQFDVWLVRFDDTDVRDMVFEGPEAEAEAWAAWERHAPGYNMRVFRLAALASAPAGDGVGLDTHIRRMQEACANYLEPATYHARHPDTSKIGDCAWVREFPMPDHHASERNAAECKERRDAAFIRDMIYMLDGPEQRAAQAALASPRAAVGEDFLMQLRRVNTDRYHAWVGDGQDAGILFDAAELGGEVGELLNVVKKLEREDRGWRGSRAAPEDFADECADVLICLDKLARRKGVDLAAATVAKFNATSEKVDLPHRLALQSPPAKVE